MTDAQRLDETDRRILRAVQVDASLSLADLGERVGASSTVCWRRLKALEEVGVLRATVRLVAPERIGRGVSVMLEVRMHSQVPARREAFETFVRSRAEVIECYAMSGEWDYLMRIVVADVADYERFLMRELLNHPDVATSASRFALSQVKYTTALPV